MKILFMVLTFFVFSVDAFCSSSVKFGGPSISNGQKGKVLLSCFGNLQFAGYKQTDISLTVASRFGGGMVAEFGLPQHPNRFFAYSVSKLKNYRGLAFSSRQAPNRVSILAPNVRAKSHGLFSALVSLPEVSSTPANLICREY